MSDHIVGTGAAMTVEGRRAGLESVSPGRATGLDVPQTPYQLDVAAFSAVEVVTHAGGWLFDRVLAGWHVTVLLPGCPDVRPLRILGAETLDLQEALVAARQPAALAVATDLYADDAGVRSAVAKARDNGLTEVTLWGQTWPAELNHSIVPVHHRLSVAARAFKAHALVAAAVSVESVDPIEAFGSAAPHRCLTTADLFATD